MEGNFFKNGTIIFRAHFMFAFVGISTGMRRNQYAISLNQRLTHDGFIANIRAAIFKKAISNTYAFRKLLEEAKTYNEALEYLN